MSWRTAIGHMRQLPTRPTDRILTMSPETTTRRLIVNADDFGSGGRGQRGDRRGARQRHPHQHEPDGRPSRGRRRRPAGARAPGAVGRPALRRGRPRDRRARPRRAHVRGPARAVPRADRSRADARRLPSPRPPHPPGDVRAAGRAARRAAPRRRARLATSASSTPSPRRGVVELDRVRAPFLLELLSSRGRRRVHRARLPPGEGDRRPRLELLAASARSSSRP